MFASVEAFRLHLNGSLVAKRANRSSTMVLPINEGYLLGNAQGGGHFQFTTRSPDSSRQTDISGLIGDWNSKRAPIRSPFRKADYSLKWFAAATKCTFLDPAPFGAHRSIISTDLQTANYILQVASVEVGPRATN